MKNIFNAALLTVVMLCISFITSAQVDTSRHSAIPGLEEIKPNAVLSIDGWPSDLQLIYLLSPRCVSTVSTTTEFFPDINEFRDSIIIRTINGQFIYLSDTEKKNMGIELALPPHRFYSRIVQHYEDGTLYDKIIIHYGFAHQSTKIKHTGIMCFVIDGKVYSEQDVKDKTDDFINPVGSNGSLNATPTSIKFMGKEYEKYDAVLKIDTKGPVLNNNTVPVKN